MSEATSVTVRDLRRQWKPVKQRLSEQEKSHPTNIRFHRACSWLQQAEELGEEQLDLVLVARWIAFNSLYGQWDEEKREPAPERESWRTFLDRILALDAEGRLEKLLLEHKRLVMALLGDEYLSRFFWEDPGERQAGKARKVKFDARTWYLEKRWAIVLDRLIERIYLLRCQIMHGAATCGSRLNRQCLHRCTMMLGHLLPAVLEVWIAHGGEEDWGVMCYPPLG